MRHPGKSATLSETENLKHVVPPKKILVVDDEKGITSIVDRIASTLGFVVRTLNQPADAVATFDEFQPDILLLDLVMPEVDGIDILHELLSVGTDARIVVMSGYGEVYLQMGKDAAEFHRFGNVTTLMKPFRRADLVSVLTPQAEGVRALR